MSESDEEPVAETIVKASPLRRWALRLAIVLVLYALLGFFGLPALIKWQLPKQASEQLGRVVTLENAHLNPFTLRLELIGLQVAEADGKDIAARIGTAMTELQWRSIIHWGLVFSRLDIESPMVRVVRFEGARYNWSDVIERLAQAPSAAEPSTAPADEPAAPARFSVNNIQISDGQIDFDDRPAKLVHRVRKLALGIPFISGFPAEVERFVEPALSARVNDTPVSLDGRSRPFGEDLETVFDIALEPFDIAPYLAYLPFEPAFALESGQLATKLELAFSSPESGPKLTLAGTATVSDIDLRLRDARPLLRLPRLHTEIERIDVFAQAVHVARVSIDAPEIHVRREQNGTIDWQSLAPPAGHEAPKPEEANASPLTIRLDALTLEDGQLAFSDAAAPAKPFATRLTAMRVTLDGFSSDGSAPAQLSVSAQSEAGEQLEATSEFVLAPLRVSGQLALRDLPVAHYAPYFAQQMVGASVTGGAISLEAPFEIDDAGMRLKNAGLTLVKAALTLDGAKEPALNIASLGAEAIDVDTAGQRVTIGRLAGTDGRLALVRARGGEIDLLGIVKPGEDVPAEAPPAWQVTLKETALSDWTLRFEDRTPAKPVIITAARTAIDLGAVSASAKEPVPLRLETIIDNRGYVAAKGTVDIAQQAADLRVDIKRLELAALQGYMAQASEAKVRSARLDVAGQLQIAAGGDGAPSVRYRGDAAITDVIAVDLRNNTDFLRWKRLAFDNLDVRSAPLALAVREVNLADFYTRLILDQQGRLNFRELTGGTPTAQEQTAKTAPSAATARGSGASDSGQYDGRLARETTDEASATLPPPAADLPPIRVERIVVERGNVNYSDRFVTPNYDANLTEVGGSLKGLSTDADSVATLVLDAAIDHDAPVKISGELNPLRNDRYLDITATVTDFELPTISTYSGKYVGYGIRKGKLSAELSYKVVDRKLTAQNNVLLKQLTFGKPVDSPDAVDLPVQLAVSLLKNAKGEIDLSVPVSGTLDDPQFSIGGLVWRAFFNLIVKAVTSPFALLGAIAGGGEELDHVAFEPGVAELSAGAVGKLESLAKALKERPGLSIELTGRVDPATDEPGLREQWMLDRMRERQREVLLDAGESPPPLREIKLPEKDRDDLLEEAYDAADIEKPRNILGIAKSLPADEMRKLMIEQAPIAETELTALAKARAQAVREWLVTTGQIDNGRVFLVTGSSEAKAPSDAATSRVDFSLR